MAVNAQKRYFQENSQGIKYRNIKKSLEVLLGVYEGKLQLRIKINVCSI